MIKYIKIHDENIIATTQENNHDCEFSTRCTHTKHNIKHFCVVDSTEHFDIVTDICIVPKRMYTLIYAIFSTGDSFSSHSGQIEYIGIYDTDDNSELIALNISRLKSATSETVKLLADNEEEYLYGIPWHGYFETLESINTIQIRYHENDCKNIL